MPSERDYKRVSEESEWSELGGALHLRNASSCVLRNSSSCDMVLPLYFVMRRQSRTCSHMLNAEPLK